MNERTGVGVVLGPGLDALGAGLAVPVSRRVAGESPADAATRVRQLCDEGAGILFVVDSAVSVSHEAADGGRAFRLVSDHLNLTGDNPLVGANDSNWGPRFPDLTDAWSPDLRDRLRDAGSRVDAVLTDGVVAGVRRLSPTTAELRMYEALGADMASEGFVAEAITGRHAGCRLAGLAVIEEEGRAAPDDDVRRVVDALVRALSERGS